MVRIGIIGAAGLSGRELLYLLESHDEASVELLTSSKYQGKKVNDVFPELTGYNQVFRPNDIDVTGCDLVFLAIPNQASLERVPNLLEQGVRVIDLSGAFRLRDYHPLWLAFPNYSNFFNKTTGLVRFRSPLLTESQLISFPLGT